VVRKLDATAEGEASRKVIELKPPPRRGAGRNYQLLLKVKSETATRFAALPMRKACPGEFLDKAHNAFERETGQAKNGSRRAKGGRNDGSN
jgi:hypothetical protein